MTRELSEAAHEGAAATPDELRAEIERARADLGDTVAALAAKADVKARVKDRAGELRERAAERARATGAETRSAATRGPALGAVAVGAGVLAAGIAAWLTRRR
ncbi:DUF3618 domain-containing protein [Actinomadura atramentaria]|uniref:DUF3618 domain-containing protein n=1 Tax=Actinomadura atramentaria TaxID=1990 RepID=UPI0003763D86|nr:DUF3618 domain-containing protein [Actinomadura atramentaria]